MPDDFKDLKSDIITFAEQHRDEVLKRFLSVIQRVPDNKQFTITEAFDVSFQLIDWAQYVVRLIPNEIVEKYVNTKNAEAYLVKHIKAQVVSFIARHKEKSLAAGLEELKRYLQGIKDKYFANDPQQGAPEGLHVVENMVHKILRDFLSIVATQTNAEITRVLGVAPQAHCFVTGASQGSLEESADRLVKIAIEAFGKVTDLVSVASIRWATSVYGNHLTPLLDVSINDTGRFLTEKNIKRLFKK